MGKYKIKNDKKRFPKFAYGQNNSICKCKIPTPTGLWSVKNGKSFAECKCGGEYETRLCETTFK